MQLRTYRLRKMFTFTRLSSYLRVDKTKLRGRSPQAKYTDRF
jgi:hypothetical protein